MSKTVRTRFAPSPTGYMHVGNLRTALYAYLLAKKNHGSFILRIEDTDQERYVEGAVDIIYNTLRQAGLNWDEGPDIGGPVGPYIQSQRWECLRSMPSSWWKAAMPTIASATRTGSPNCGKSSRPAAFRPLYDGHCRNLSKEEVQEKLDAGIPYVIRQKCPREGTTSFEDAVFGTITVDNSTLDDQILIKTDGMPTYNFANVVDDHTMGITHVIRGNEYLSSTPSTTCCTKPSAGHPGVHPLPPGNEGRTHKLSKRNGDASFEDLIAKGYLTEAVVNYIALLGWAPKGENEIFTLDELAQEFDVAGISKSPAIFDTQKLKAINGAYIRKLSVDQFLEKALPYIRQTCKREDIDLKLLAQMLQPRTELFTDIPDQVDFIDALPDYDVEMYRHKKMKTNPENSLVSLKELLPALDAIDQADWNLEKIHRFASKSSASWA